MSQDCHGLYVHLNLQQQMKRHGARDLSRYANRLTPLQLRPNLHLGSGLAGDMCNHRRGWSPFECAATTRIADGDCHRGTEAIVMVLLKQASILLNWMFSMR